MTVDELRKALADLPADYPVVLRVLYPNASQAEIYEPVAITIKPEHGSTGIGITAHGKRIMFGFAIEAICND